MFSSWAENGQVLRKNDIYDFFFIGCADYVDKDKKESILIDRSTYLMTFDKVPLRFIDNKRPINGKRIREFM